MNRRFASLLLGLAACTEAGNDGSLTGPGVGDSATSGAVTSVGEMTRGAPDGDGGSSTDASGDSEDAEDSEDSEDSDGEGGADDSTDDGGEQAEFCPPALSAAAEAWRAEYDALFADTDSMRTYLDALPGGSGHWGQSYTLRSFVVMYELTGDTKYLHELIWQFVALRDLAEGGVTWPTGVCSNTFSYPTVVIDARFIEPMLRAAWWMANSRLADDPVPVIDELDLGGTTYGALASEIGALAAAVLASHEPDLRTRSENFGTYEGETTEYYRFDDGYSCVAGEVMPFNYANSAGHAYARLWRLTGDDEAREHAERLMKFWWNRTHAYEPSPGSTRSRWWGYRGKTGEGFDPDAFPGDSDQRPEDDGHADMTSSFAATIYALGLEGQNGTRIDQVAMSSKRWIDRAVGNGTNPAYYITNADTDGDWDQVFDHLPMSCYRPSILETLEPLAETQLTDDSGYFRRQHAENIAELAYFNEFTQTDPACGPSCGDGVCNGPEDCVGCPQDCACPVDGC